MPPDFFDDEAFLDATKFFDAIPDETRAVFMENYRKAWNEGNLESFLENTRGLFVDLMTSMCIRARAIGE